MRTSIITRSEALRSLYDQVQEATAYAKLHGLNIVCVFDTVRKGPNNMNTTQFCTPLFAAAALRLLMVSRGIAYMALEDKPTRWQRFKRLFESRDQREHRIMTNALRFMEQQRE